MDEGEAVRDVAGNSDTRDVEPEQLQEVACLVDPDAASEDLPGLLVVVVLCQMYDVLQALRNALKLERSGGSHVPLLTLSPLSCVSLCVEKERKALFSWGVENF